jgi:methylated-DNA-[protein]-cysteine S-methyltransferase
MTAPACRNAGLTLVETRLGWIGLAWSAHGLTQLQLPEATRAATLRRLRMRAGDVAEVEAPAPVREAIALILRFASGEPVDFSGVAIDIEEVDAFRRAIYAATREIGYGHTTTYGALCAAAGHPGMARETGQAMATNPLPLIVPCHRVLAAGGRLGGFSAPGGASAKLRLLDLEKSRPPSPPGQGAFAF